MIFLSLTSDKNRVMDFIARFFVNKKNFLIQSKYHSHKKQIKNKNHGDVKNKNRIKFVITSKNFSQMFQYFSSDEKTKTA